MVISLQLNKLGILVFGYLAALNVLNTLAEPVLPVLLVHGGAGTINDESLPAAYAGVKRAARIGYATMQSSGSVLDAVQAAVGSLEEDPTFNAGYGGVLTWEGRLEMDAAIMNGADLDGGCVAVARNILHPINLARRIMEKTSHKFLADEGAMAFARKEQFDILPEGLLVTEASRKALEDYKNSLKPTDRADHSFGSQGTVGAVAIDEHGNVAAATSTGGLTGKLPGRIGDSPLLGAGTYADNEMGALSATGHGETIMRFNVASRVLNAIKYENLTAQEAVELVLNEMTKRFGQTAGLISVDKNGQLGIHFTTNRMNWAYQRGDELHYGAKKGEDLVEKIGEPRLNETDWPVNGLAGNVMDLLTSLGNY